MDELLDELGRDTIFTVLDSRSAYWAIEVAEEDRPKTAFTDGSRLWQFKRLPFGLATAPSTYQRTINLILSSVLGRHSLAYLDDVVVHSSSFSNHLADLDETLALLHKAGLKLNLQKCSIACKEIKFLGFKVGPDGIAPDPEKVASIMDLPQPRNVKGVRRFLGATGFFRRHIKDYAHKALPLTTLTRKGVDFVWSDQCQEAFETLKGTVSFQGGPPPLWDRGQ